MPKPIPEARADATQDFEKLGAFYVGKAVVEAKRRFDPDGILGADFLRFD